MVDLQKQQLKEQILSEANKTTNLLRIQNLKSHSEKVKEAKDNLTFYESFLYNSLKGSVDNILRNQLKLSQSQINKVVFDMEKKLCGLETMKQYHKIKKVSK
jgi:hypothetical protein